MDRIKQLWRVVCACVVIALVATVSVLVPVSAPADAAGTGSLLINEFIASNSSGLVDEDGETSDWIELYNPSTSSVNLAGWSLTDSALEPTLWTFPSATVPANGYLVVFASNKDRAVAGGELHTNFKLSAGGEYLALVEADGSTVADDYAPSYPAQISDVSYGRTGTGLGYFAAPTPGSANGAASGGFAEPVTMSLDHGFYDSPQVVTLSTPTPGALIRYTLDGSLPSASTGQSYTAPITVDQTTTLRAASVVPGFIDGDVSTSTYLFLDDIVSQSATPAGFPTGAVNGQVLNYGMDPDIVNGNSAAVQDALQSIPTISVVTDVDNLFDPATGIYVNPAESGREWERAASVELIDPSGAEAGFEIEAGLRIRGGFSRSTANPKHAFRLFFRNEYGGTLDYPLFGAEGTDSFEKIDFRTAQNYSWSFRGSEKNTLLREVFSRDLQAALEQPYTRTRSYHLYLNGQYWGIFHSQERVSKEYAASYFGGSEDDYDVVKHDRQNGYRFDATDGDDAAWRSLWPIIQDQQVDAVEYAQLDSVVDLDSLIDAQLIYAYTGDIDGSPSRFLSNQRGNNWYSLRNRTGSGDAGKWLFFVHDGEHAVGARDHDPDIDRSGPFPTGAANPNYTIDFLHPYWIHSALLSNPEYVARFEARANMLLRGNGPMTPAASQARWDAREAIIAPAVLAESARWGDAKRATPFTVSDWATEVAWVENVFLPVRTANVIEHLALPAVLPNDPPVVNAPGAQSSVVANDASLTVTATDPEGQPVTWTAVGLPAGLTIDTASGVISGRPVEAGVVQVTVTATDTLGESDSEVFTWTTSFPTPSRMILNEWNAVDSGAFLKNGGSDSALGTILGNGGDWFELVVIEDNLDLRGWTLEISDNSNAGVQEVTDLFEFADQNLLASLRSGTIITISEDFADDISYDPAGGDWNLNLQANSGDAGAFFTADSQSNFSVNNDNWQLTIRDATGAAVFGPGGEGAPASGVGSDEIGELEDNPSAAITPASLYDDGNDSTFGQPNGFDNGFQDFGPIRPTFADTIEPDSTIELPLLGSSVLPAVTFSGTATDDVGVASVRVAIKNRDSGEWLQADGSFGAGARFFETALGSPDEVLTDWSYSTTLPEGPFFVVARAEDTSSNRESSRPSTRFDVEIPTVDVENPSAQITVPATREELAGSSVVLSGTATDDSEVSRVRVAIINRTTGERLQADGSFAAQFKWLDATLSAPGALTTDWSFAADLPDDDYAITVDVLDAAGKRNDPRPRVVFSVSSTVADVVEPGTVIDAPAVREAIVGPTLTSFGTASDDVGVARVRVGVQDVVTKLWVQADGTFGPFVLFDSVLDAPGATATGWSLPVTLPAGEYALSARAVDMAGNTDSARPRVRFSVS